MPLDSLKAIPPPLFLLDLLLEIIHGLSKQAVNAIQSRSIHSRVRPCQQEGSDDVRGILKNVLHNFTISPASTMNCRRESKGTVFMGIGDENPFDGAEGGSNSYYLFLV